MNIIYPIIFFILLIIVSNFNGKIIEKIKIPSLIGMMLTGLIVGPYVLNITPETILKIAPLAKDIALIVVLFIGGLGISVDHIKRIGRAAIFLSIIPATLEGFTVAFLSTILLDFTFIQGAILGFIIAAVSPAVLIPAMVSLISKKVGQKKIIPQLLLVGASADDTVAITFFTTFITLYFARTTGTEFNLLENIVTIPISIILSLVIGWIVSFISNKTFLKISNNKIKALLIFIVCFSMRSVEKYLHIEIFNSLLAIMTFGFFVRYYIKDDYEKVLEKMNIIWKYGKISLFTFVGMAINPSVVGGYFYIGTTILFFSLIVRSIGVLISLIGTNLNWRERLFCIIAYLPKATVQSAKAGIPLELGIIGGDVMQGIAILSVLITAPIGAIGIEMTYKKLLKDS